MSTQQALEMLKQRKQTMTLDQLSKRLSVPSGTVQRWLKRGKMNTLYAAHVVQVLSQ